MGGTKGQQKSSFLGSADKAITGAEKPDQAIPHNGVPYAKLKEKLLKDNALFEDPDFPAVDSSLFFSRKPPHDFVWKRPGEIVSNPSLFVGGASRFDITQGMLGDCWLLASVAALCQYEGLLYQVVPPDQSFEKEYCGLVRFRFWQYGRWEEVVVDDRLPTLNNRLCFLHSSENNEFWTALLEKAYAKLCGSYEALKGGQTSEAMEDFTGGVTETFTMDKKPEHFFKLLLKAEERQSLMCCAIDAKPGEIEAKLDNGLIKGHAYTITGVKKVNAKGKDVELLRIRNPWGNEKEWTGAWSDDSKEWTMLTEQQKKEMGLSYDDDGEFWMDYNDFIANFTKVEVCMLSPDSAGDSDAKCWEMVINQGTWQANCSAGGCRNYPDSFHTNPQFRIKLEDPDEDDDIDGCTIVIGVIQKGRRKAKRVGAQNLTIGFAIYQLDEDSEEYIENDRMSKDFFLYNKMFAKSANFINGREVIGRFTLPPAEYVIIPTTFKPNEEGDFILRMFSEKAHEAEVMDTATEIEIKTKVVTEEDNAKFDTTFKPFFDKVAGDDQEIDPFELQAVVNEAFKKELEGKDASLECCRSMLAMMDRDRSGKLDYEEFRELWRTVTDWKDNFNSYDADKSGDMNAIELRDALAKLGFKLGTPVLSSISLRYANKQGHVSLDDYLQVCCRVKSAFEAYVSYQGNNFSLDNYIMSAVYT